MNNLISRIKNAINAFRGKPICTITYGVKLTRCDECENNIRCEECVYQEWAKNGKEE